MRSDAPAATRGRDRRGPPRSKGGSYTHRPILNHEGGAESPPAMSRKGWFLQQNPVPHYGGPPPYSLAGAAPESLQSS